LFNLVIGSFSFQNGKMKPVPLEKIRGWLVFDRSIITERPALVSRPLEG
jgi:hypothetical protein